MITTSKISKRELLDGQVLFKFALAVARRRPPEHSEGVADHWMQSRLGRYQRISNLEALIIREGDECWVQIFMLARVPRGWPNDFGTSPGSPLQSKQATYRHALAALRDRYWSEQSGRAPAHPDAGFSLIIDHDEIHVSRGL